jgi:hypothetical protein
MRESANLRVGHDIIKAPFGYILVALETEEGAFKGGSIWLTAVSSDGKILRESQVHIPFMLPKLSKGTTIDASGDLVLAVSGKYPDSVNQSTPVQFNPLTGAHTFVCPSSTSLIFSIDPQTFAVRRQMEVKDGFITSIRVVDGDVFGIQNVDKGCELAKLGIRLIQVDMSRQSMQTLFQTETTNSVDAMDFETTNNGFVVVGRVWLFLPPFLANPTMSSEQLQNFPKQYFLDESRYDKSDTITNAAILNIRRDGKLIGDKVIHDTRNGWLMGVARRGVGGYVASGKALGDIGWVVEFSALTN